MRSPNLLRGTIVRLTAPTQDDLSTMASWYEDTTALSEKLGFQREGVYRERLSRDGKRYDMYLYGLLRREWEPREA